MRRDTRTYPLSARQRMALALAECTCERSIRRWERDPASVTESVRLRIERGLRSMGVDPYLLHQRQAA